MQIFITVSTLMSQKPVFNSHGCSTQNFSPKYKLFFFLTSTLLCIIFLCVVGKEQQEEKSALHLFSPPSRG